MFADRQPFVFTHPIIWLILFSILYYLCTYKVKKLKKMKFSKSEEAAGKAYACAYFLMFVICFYVALRPYLGTNEIMPIVKNFALLYATWELVIELAIYCLLRVSRLGFKKILYAGAKFAGANPEVLIFLRVLGVILFVFYLLAILMKI